MSDYKTILYQKQRKGVLITLNRPQALNAINEELMGELDHALAEAETDPEIRAVVLTGADGAFSVGEDISGDDPETAWPYGIPVGTSLNATYNEFRDADRKDILGRQLYRWQYPKPIVAAVSGWCLGAGSSLALTCHVTIAADDAIFGQPQVRHGANLGIGFSLGKGLVELVHHRSVHRIQFFGPVERDQHAFALLLIKNVLIISHVSLLKL